MNHHSNPVSSQQKPNFATDQLPRQNHFVGQTQSRATSQFYQMRPLVQQRNYRQIPIRTRAVENQLNSLKQKFEPHNVKNIQQAPLPQKVEIRKVARPNVPLITNIIPNPQFPSNLTHTPTTPIYNTSFQNKPAKKSLLPVANTEIYKIYSEGYQQKLDPNKPRGLIAKSKFYYQQKFKSRPKKSTKIFRNKRAIAAVMMFLISATIFGVSGFMYYQRTTNPNTTAVAGVVENTIEYPKISEYTSWIETQNGSFSNPSEDLDNDQLTNYEEFVIGSDPLLANTCDPEKTDSQNLFNFIDPASCKPIDFQNPAEVTKFEELISFPNLRDGFIDPAPVENAPVETSSSNLLNLFGIQNYTDLNSITTESLDQQLVEKTTKKEYLRLVGRIEDYIKQFRSYEVYDRDYQAPVHPAVYLDVSLKYQVPLKYTIAIARTESRFGTDRYTNTGALTRPGQYQNIYSMGLTDGGKNLKFNRWEDGVESFGKWYKKFQDRGVSNCSKWRIYNPNGDYCSKIESLAASIDIYLQSN